MGPTMSPETYQQVKGNLHWYMAIVCLIFSIFVFAILVPEIHRQWVRSIISNLIASSMPGLVTDVSVAGILTFVSWLFIFLFEAHDKLYDKYVIRWRYFYDLDFILPNLTRPFGSNLAPNFFRVAERNLHVFMKPFYKFVGDGEHEFSITKNVLIRFYEVVTKYWITQINEIMLVAAFTLNASYFVVYRNLHLASDRIALIGVILPALFLLNRMAAHSFREQVRRATLDEIEEIQHRFPVELERSFMDLHSDLNLRWQP